MVWEHLTYKRLKNMKIGCIGDLHFKDNLSYADYISDRRVGEKKEVLDCIVNSFKNCDAVVILGDNFNSKNNTSETNRSFVEFIERFNDKEVFIIAGNHEKRGDGKSAIDFLGEIKKPNWHIFTRPGSFPLKNLKLDFLPFMSKSELGVENNIQSTEYVISHLDGGDILFTHHAISGTSFNGISVDNYIDKEILLPKKELENKYKLVVAGHIHDPKQYGRTVVTGSVFTDSVGELKKYVWIINDDFTLEPIALPGRPILKLENPTYKDLEELPNNCIVKVTLTDKSIDVEDLKSLLKKFDAWLIIENYPSERKKMHIEKGAAFDFSIDNLLKLYSQERKVDLSKLMKGMSLIK